MSNSDQNRSVPPSIAGGDSLQRNAKPCSSRATKTNRICHVCGDVAKSYHFGGICCDSCKAFFRRTVLSKSYLGFMCAHHNSMCEITTVTRKLCQLCRFQKCKQIGMEEKWVQGNEDRVGCQKQRVEKKQQKEGSYSRATECPEILNESSEQSNGQIDIPYEPDVSRMLYYMTTEEQQEIADLIYETHQSYIDVPYKVSQCPPNRDSVEIIEMFTTILRRMVFFHKNLDNFNKLSLDDQSTLLRHGVLEMCMLRSALTYDIKNNRWPCKTGNLEFLKNCPVLRVEDMKKLVSAELYELQMKFISGLQKLEADEPVIVLLSLIALFYPDRSGLEDTINVGLVQDKYLSFLKKYILWRYGPKGSKLYPKFLAKLSDLRQLNDAHNVFTLNLAPKEVSQIQEQLSSLNLNLYTQWDLVRCDSNIIGSVDPVPNGLDRETGDSSSCNETSAKKIKVNSFGQEFSASVQDQLSNSSLRGSNNSKNASQTGPNMAGIMFAQMLNRQIPLLIKDPMAEIPRPQGHDLSSVGHLFGSQDSTKLV